MAMCLVKFKAPPRFSVKGEEGVTNWMERYEVLVEYNWWTDLDKRKNFGLYLEGPERQFTALLLWGETAVVAVTHRIRAVPAVHGMRTVFMNEFVQGGPARYQEVTLRKRKQGIKRSGVYYYEFMNLSRLVNPAMTEEAKMEYLFKGLRHILVGKKCELGNLGRVRSSWRRNS